ncbi:ATP-binding protein [Pseudidiomarina aestuarii]|uniref:hybrid sensor histidine kinase/response regulator n=1 Tax=Pseudidiomarina aestuarii TaxID=624146 RepID=UPI003A96A280
MRISLPRLLIVAVIFLLVVEIWIQYTYGLKKNDEALQSYSATLTDLQSRQVSDRIADLTATYESMLALTLLELDEIPRDGDWKSLYAEYFLDVIRSNPRLNGIFFGTEDNALLGYVRLDDERFDLMEVRSEDPTQTINFWELDSEDERVRTRVSSEGFVVAQRSWFEQTQEPLRLYWNDPFPYYAYNVIALPLNVRLPDQWFNQKVVISLNLYNTQLQQELARLVAAFPGEGILLDQNRQLVTASNTELTTFCQQTEQPCLTTNSDGQTDIQIAEQHYQMTVTPIALDATTNWYFVALIDTSQTLEPMRQALRANALLSALIAALGVLAFYLIARSVVRPLSTMAEEMDAASRQAELRHIDIQALPHGRLVPSEVTTLKTAFKRFVGAINTAFDEQQAMNTELQIWKEIFDKAKIGIALSGQTDPTIMRSNPYFANLLGRTQEELIGTKVKDYLDPPTQKKLIDVVERVNRGETVNYSGNMLHSAGHEVPVIVTVSAVLNDEGDIAYRIAMILDRTEIEDLYRQLQQTQRLRSLGILTSGVVHDFNNLLSGIILNAELLETRVKRIDDIHQRQQLTVTLQQIEEAATHAGQLVKQILLFSREENDEAVPVDIARVIQDSMVLVSVGQAPNSVRLLRADPDVWVLGNRSQLQQLIMNLLSNALKANQRIQSNRPVEVSIEQGYFKRAPDQSCAVIRVRDHGDGIAAALRGKVFEPFVAKDTRGIGLGLAIVKRIVELHEGEIDFDSAQTHAANVSGTEFIVRLPLASPRNYEPSASVVIDASVARGDIVVVDDDPTLMRALTQLLNSRGWSATAFSSADSAYSFLEQNAERVHYLITDLVMKGQSGHDLTLAAKRLNRNLKVILMTGYLEEHERTQLLADGVDHIILKPVQLQSILDALAAVAQPQLERDDE